MVTNRLWGVIALLVVPNAQIQILRAVGHADLGCKVTEFGRTAQRGKANGESLLLADPHPHEDYACRSIRDSEVVVEQRLANDGGRRGNVENLIPGVSRVKDDLVVAPPRHPAILPADQGDTLVLKVVKEPE